MADLTEKQLEWCDLHLRDFRQMRETAKKMRQAIPAKGTRVSEHNVSESTRNCERHDS